MRHEFVDYINLISFPFVFIWAFVFCLPQKAFGLKLAAQIFSFIFVRDAMIKTSMWSISPDLTLKFIDDAETLFYVSAASLFMAGLVYTTNTKYCKITFWRKNPVHSIMMGLFGGVFIYIPVYFLKSALGSTTGAVISDFSELLGNLSLALCGNLVEELLFRSSLSSYLNNYGTTALQSVVLQASAFALFHMYLAFMLTQGSGMILLFTFYEGFICAILHRSFGLAAATVAHGLAIFFITINFAR